MVDTLAGYLGNIAAAATTTGRGTKMADLDARMAILVDTNTAQPKELKENARAYQCLEKQQQQSLSRHKRPNKDSVTSLHISGTQRAACQICMPLQPQEHQNRPTWAKELMKAKGVAFDAGK